MGAERSTAQQKWQEEFSRLLEGKASEISKRESLHVQLHRQMAKEKERLQEEYHKAVAILETEKAELHQKWEVAVNESLVLQQEKAEMTASFASKSLQARQQWERNFFESVSFLQKELVKETPSQQDTKVESAHERVAGILLRNSSAEPVKVSATLPAPTASEEASNSTQSIPGSVASLQEARFFPEQGDSEKELPSRIALNTPVQVDLRISGQEVHQKQPDTLTDAQGELDVPVSKWGSVCRLRPLGLKDHCKANGNNIKASPEAAAFTEEAAFRRNGRVHPTMNCPTL